MNSITRRATIFIILTGLISMAFGLIGLSRKVESAQGAPEEARAKREELYRANNLGVALMEQYKHEEAVNKFREALARDPSFTIGRINLALALYFLNDGKSATAEALEALKLAPKSPQALYVLGASYKKDRLYPEEIGRAHV